MLILGFLLQQAKRRNTGTPFRATILADSVTIINVIAVAPKEIITVGDECGLIIAPLQRIGAVVKVG